MLRSHLLRGSRFLTNKSQFRFVKVKQDANKVCIPLRQVSQAVNVLEKVDGYKPGDKIHGFTVEQVVPVPELYLTAVKLNHDKTGAQYLHIARDDTNNVFSVSFRTTPMDSTGVPHILEHTTLCGSQKYPCRDPFFKMLNRSLSTFMNAWTASDYTMYPFSTMNSQDFDNLLSVYLDAAFFPRLRELDFSQEGWRLEHENNKDSTSPIIFKGVVFNEMKGALTSPESIFGLHSQNKLLPSHTYSHNSGGEPLDIPDLTWQQLKNFHATHYHPSNARFYTYGNLPMEKHLEQIDQLVLQKYERIDPMTEVPSEVRWTEPREFHVHCAPDPMAADPEKQTTVSLNYLLGSVTDQFESFVMSFVASLLVHGPPAPFYKSLLSSNIGSDYSTGTGFCGSTKDATFGVGLQGIKEEDVEKVKQLIEQTFDEVIASGFEAERIEAILHMIELSQKHQSTSFGLGIVSSLMSSWNHDRDPVSSLQVNKQVERFKQCLADDPNFLQDKVRQYFKKNSHKMVLVMTPKEDFKKESEDAEQEKLAAMVAGLTDQDKETLYKKGLELEEQQNMEEDLSCLPTLKVSDISPELPVRTHFDLTNIAGVQVQCSEQPTNGVTYFRGLSSLKNLPQELIQYVPLFSEVITRMGAGDMSFQELAQREELKTGGLSMGTHLCQYHSDILSYEQGLALSSYSLDRNLGEMFSLWTEIFNRPNMSDNERLATLVRMSASDLAMSLAHAGHSYAMKGACSSLSPVGRLKEIMGGMTQVTFMKGIAEAEDMTETMTKLQEVAKHVLSKENIRCAINSSPEFMTSAVKQLESFLETLPGNAGSESVFLKQESDFAPSQLKNHYELPFPVNYMSRGVHTVPYTHPDYPALRVLARLMSSKFLHREIREKGGAYGGGAAMGMDGVFKFYSYRDPNSAATLESFSRSVEWGVKGDYTQQQIDEAKLAIFSDVDGPVAPASKGMTFFLSRISDDMRQTQRQGLFAVNKQNLIDVAQRYLTPASQVTSEAFLGPENPMTKDTAQGWTVHKETM